MWTDSRMSGQLRPPKIAWTDGDSEPESPASASFHTSGAGMESQQSLFDGPWQPPKDCQIWDSMTQRRKGALVELIRTEQSYVGDLQRIIVGYVNAIPDTVSFWVVSLARPSSVQWPIDGSIRWPPFHFISGIFS